MLLGVQIDMNFLEDNMAIILNAWGFNQLFQSVDSFPGVYSKEIVWIRVKKMCNDSS